MSGTIVPKSYVRAHRRAAWDCSRPADPPAIYIVPVSSLIFCPRLLAGPLGIGLSGLLLAGCGASASPTTGDPGSKTPSSAPSAAPITASPMTGTAVHGTGYRFSVPRDWRDVTARLDRDDVDRAAAAAVPDHGFDSNVNVVVTDGRVAPGQLPAVVGRIHDQMQSSAPGYRVLAPRTVAGVRAGRLAGVRHQGDASYWLEQYVFARGDHTYIVSFSFSPKVPAPQRSGTIESVLASWRWDPHTGTRQ